MIAILYAFATLGLAACLYNLAALAHLLHQRRQDRLATAATERRRAAGYAAWEQLRRLQADLDGIDWGTWEREVRR